jgi:hypothetical protein
MNAPFLSGSAAPFDPFQRAAVVTSPADPATVLLQRWRAAGVAHIEANAQAAAAEEAYFAIAGPCPTTHLAGKELYDESMRGWWAGYEQAVGALSKEETRLGFLGDDLETAIINAPATPLGIAAKIELALHWLPDDPHDDYLPILLAAKADAERLAGRAQA